MSRGARVVHVVYECVPGEFRGGVQKAVLELASAQAALGAAVEIWAVDDVRAGSVTPVPTAGAPVRLRWFAGERTLGNLRSQAIAEAMAREPGIGVLHGHNTFHWLNVQIGRAARKRAIPAFFHPHGALDPALFAGTSASAAKKRLWNAWVEVPNLSRAAGVIALTPLEAEQLRAVGVRAPIHVIPNGIRPPATPGPDARARFRARHGIAAQAPVVLFIGRLVAKKRVEWLIDALASERLAGAVGVIAGNRDQEPAYTAALDARAAAAGLGDRLRWVGFLDETSKPDAFAAADVFVHSSTSEGMAMAILEAMAAGLPTVVTRGCYMGEAAAAGAVREVDGFDDFVAAIAGLLSDEGAATALAVAGRQHARTVHDWARVAARLLDVYAAAGADLGAARDATEPQSG